LTNTIHVRIEKVRRQSNGLYEARLTIIYRGKEYRINLGNLIREPGYTRTRILGDYLLIELRGRDKLPLATCCIHREHLEKGCTECPSLLLPPREGMRRE